MSGKTSGIGQFCELSWHKVVKFCSTTVFFPVGQLVLRKYLGPSINVGPTMTTKILTPTGKVVHCSTYRPLTPEELADPVEQDHMTAILWAAGEQWCTHLARGQLNQVGLVNTPYPQPYLDEHQVNKSFPALEEEVTPETGDEYIQAYIMIL